MPVEDIIRELAALERQIVGVKKAHNETPESLSNFPCFINRPGTGVLLHAASDLGVAFHTIMCELHIDRRPLPEAEAKARPFIKRFWKIIAANDSLNGTASSVNEIRYFYGPLDFAGETHIGIRFELDVKELDTDIVTST